MTTTATSELRCARRTREGGGSSRAFPFFFGSDIIIVEQPNPQVGAPSLPVGKGKARERSTLRPAPSPSPPPPTKRTPFVLLSNLPVLNSTKDLDAMFEKYGASIRLVRSLRDVAGRRAIASFKSLMDARLAITELEGTRLGGRIISFSIV